MGVKNGWLRYEMEEEKQQHIDLPNEWLCRGACQGKSNHWSRAGCVLSIARELTTVLSCLVWSTFNRKADGLASAPGMFTQRKQYKENRVFLSSPWYSTYQEYDILGLHTL